jgi:hypothetical protein
VACDEAGELARIGEGRGGGAASPLSLAAGAVKTEGVERRGWVGSGVLVVSLSFLSLSYASLRCRAHSLFFLPKRQRFSLFSRTLWQR